MAMVQFQELSIKLSRMAFMTSEIQDGHNRWNLLFISKNYSYQGFYKSNMNTILYYSKNYWAWIATLKVKNVIDKT